MVQIGARRPRTHEAIAAAQAVACQAVVSAHLRKLCANLVTLLPVEEGIAHRRFEEDEPYLHLQRERARSAAHSAGRAPQTGTGCWMAPKGLSYHGRRGLFSRTPGGGL